ncbi:MAG: alpha-glucuronidase family glycosyl hydrolase [Bacillota bacterium]|nr:alpha-glucuronidase family glycosyl hydrolase [Bacillota bacterium]
MSEDLYESCWLNYRKIEDPYLLKQYSNWCANFVAVVDTPLIQSALNEFDMGIRGMLGIIPFISTTVNKTSFVIVGVLGNNPEIDREVSVSEQNSIMEDGYLIKNIKAGGKCYIVVTGKNDRGVLYGIFELLRLIRINTDLNGIAKIENPCNALRVVNHWDNMDGSIERGYAGKSIFFEDNKITRNLKRIRSYGRLLASIGINGVVINNVNAHETETKLITKEYLPYVAEIADVFREYGIRLFLSVNFASPIELGGLRTADPLDDEVKNWWQKKAEEIYAYICDFGGFLVKADSEFRPGPFTYNRNHADGANMLAEAVKPHGGVVFWRCFVYNCLQDWRNKTIDRAKAAYDHFMPLDGMFNDNVVLQIKNGPMDFQVREPVSPLFGGLTKTKTMLELQITQEYTGQQKHLCYLAPMWKEIMNFDTCCKGEGSTVDSIISGVAGVANVGDDLNWTGFQLAQSNLFGFGRLVWNPSLSSREITEEWVRMTYSNDEEVVNTVLEMLLKSWKIYESYTSPLGIGWMVNPGHHYGPNVDGYEYSKWGTYHRADLEGIGVDRTVRSGTGFTKQYCSEIASKYEKLDTCPEELLLFFHHVPYTYRLKSGETLIQYIYNTHFDGADEAVKLKEKWQSLREKIKEPYFLHVLERLEGQIEHAKEWRDVINSYFYRKSGIKDELGRQIY